MLRALRRQSIRWLTLLVLLELASLTLGVQLAAHLRYFADAPALAGFGAAVNTGNVTEDRTRGTLERI